MQHRVSLAGHGVRLVPLAPLQAEQLFPLIDAELWSGMAAPRPETPEALARLFAMRLNDPGALPFAVAQDSVAEGSVAAGSIAADSVGTDSFADDMTGALIGTTGLYELNSEEGRTEVGGTFFGRAYWGSGANDASKLLLLGHAFDALGLSRVGFRVDTRNRRSAKALLRMGAQYEGTLRSYRAMGQATMGAEARSDTAVFSVLDTEWSAVRARLLDRLARRDETCRDAA
ncbi:GNAT family N-acetyltransferase [Sinomonas terrae]|uniref:GNAT family N-acetyltransferase n=1 Tax=Sinomonas terrae TaxID=2908838 RepID=A0ABS9U2C1_9MICC|nr:GNAT family protein [Sinomonas terrae]MCH6470848.1 GNAT family N-acetyltransferase [Sinomonas terrae]